MLPGTSFTIPTSDKTVKCLLSLIMLGMALFISTCIVSVVGLALATWFILQQIFRLFVEITTYANHSDILTQILLILVIGFVLQKVYSFLARGARGLRF